MYKNKVNKAKQVRWRCFYSNCHNRDISLNVELLQADRAKEALSQCLLRPVRLKKLDFERNAAIMAG